MTARLTAYLGFSTEARAAMEFYAAVFGGTPAFTTFADGGMPTTDPADAAKIMHGHLQTPAGFDLMASDAPTGMVPDTGSSIQLALSGGPEDDAELRGWWARLTEGGQITEPLVTAPWGDTFGMCTDRFGTRWMVSIGAAGEG